VTVQQPLDTIVASTVQHYDEYGNALDDTAAVTYGWLGGRQRSSATLSGYTLMGVRVYDPATGRFLQTDPVVDGSPNHYGYPVDPVNMSDLTGQSWYYRLRCIALIASLLLTFFPVLQWAKIAKVAWYFAKSAKRAKKLVRAIRHVIRGHKANGITTGMISSFLGWSEIKSTCKKW
jgi:RHS repeat-associated protein